jgi:hypothetical protein
LNSMCQILPWTNMLVMLVQGCCESSAGVKPRRLITASGLSKVSMKIKTFRAIKNHRTFKLTAR